QLPTMALVMEAVQRIYGESKGTVGFKSEGHTTLRSEKQMRLQAHEHVEIKVHDFKIKVTKDDVHVGHGNEADPGVTIEKAAGGKVILKVANTMLKVHRTKITVETEKEVKVKGGKIKLKP